MAAEILHPPLCQRGVEDFALGSHCRLIATSALGTYRFPGMSPFSRSPGLSGEVFFSVVPVPDS